MSLRHKKKPEILPIPKEDTTVILLKKTTWETRVSSKEELIGGLETLVNYLPPFNKPNIKLRIQLDIVED